MLTKFRENSKNSDRKKGKIGVWGCADEVVYEVMNTERSSPGVWGSGGGEGVVSSKYVAF